MPFVYKYDQYPADFPTALAQMNGQSLATQPGFAQGEAFGQVFRPSPGAYPLQITGVDFLFAAAPLNPDLRINATIEVYNSTSTGPDPQSQPIFTVSTGAIWNAQTQDFGLPIQGGVGYSITFDLEDDQNHPPQIFSGNIFVVIRFDDAPTETTSGAWGVLECTYLPGFTCGCQGTGALLDPVTSPNANIMYTYPMLQCSGGGSWDWAQGSGVAGDFILRMRAEVASTPCVPDCTGKACGDNGCGGSCGGCAGGTQCYQYQCVSCVPSCIGKQCGDNGCGGSCGTCPAGDVCDAGWCEAPCAPSCGDRVCGDDGCGGECGTCPTGHTCNAGGKCIAPCAPSCAATNGCGDDGCGGSCGTCAVGSSCEAGQCVATCAPACEGRECGPDGCGGICGSCGAGEACAEGQCEAVCAPVCAGRACGGDGCGGSCGSCGAGEACSDAGQCAPIVCAPDCAGRACGDDGCGGSCGSCADGASCGASGQCSAAPGLALTDVSPDFGFASEATPVSVTGQGFAEGVSVLIGGRALEGVTRVSSSVLTGSVPAGLNPGTYTVIATNPGGASATLPDAFEVRVAPTPATKDEGCAGGGASALWALASALWALALGGLALALRRRLRAR